MQSELYAVGLEAYNIWREVNYAVGLEVCNIWREVNYAVGLEVYIRD